MTDHARLFKSGGSQAVRLPRKFRFEGQEEVLIYRRGERVILEPIRRGWSSGFLALAGSAPEFPDLEDFQVVEPGPDFDA